MGTGAIPAGVLEAVLPGSKVPIYFMAERRQFGDRPFFYGYKDDPYRFAFFSRAALDLVDRRAGLAARSRPRPRLAHRAGRHLAGDRRPSQTRAMPPCPRFTPSTICRHQGNAPWHVFQHFGLLTHGLAEERFGEVNFMARGIYHATMVSTVSPTYAREIMTYEGGSGLDKLLRHRHLDVHGILNGLDYEVWDPATDRHLAAPLSTPTTHRAAARQQARSAVTRRLAHARRCAARGHDHAPGRARRAWTSPATSCTC